MSGRGTISSVSPRTPPERALTRARLDAQLLCGPPVAGTEQVLERLLAVQAQDRRGARLAVRARSGVSSADDVDQALTRRRTALVTWLNRGTLHLVAAEDYWWLHPLTTPQLRTGNERRLRQEGLDPPDAHRGIDIVAEAVSTGGPRSREELRGLLDAAGVPTGGQAFVHLLYAASLRGLIVGGPVRDGRQLFADVPGWLGPAPAPIGKSEGLARLARRYLAGHGPSSAADLARWAGIGLGQARSGLASLADEVVVRPDELFALADRGPPAPLPSPRLLGPFDPVLHGWVDRKPLLGSHRGVVTVNGIFRATALVGGRVVGTWRMVGGRVLLDLLEEVSRSGLAALERDARSVAGYLGMSGGPGPALMVEPPSRRAG
jgi:hypothetical protein